MVHFDAQNTGYAPTVTGPTSEVSEQWQQPVDRLRSASASCPVLAGKQVYTGMSTEQAVLGSFSAADGTRAWQFRSGTSSSTPAVGDGSLYFGDDGVIYAIDSADGTVEWSVATNGFLMTSVTLEDGTVYTSGGPRSRRLYAIDAGTGSVEWTHSTDDLDGPLINVPPAVDSAGVVVSVDVYTESSSRPQLRSLSLDGEEQWRYEIPASYGSLSTPVLWNDRVYVSIGDYGIVALNRETGESEWAHRVDDLWALNGILSSPAVADGTVYGTSSGRELFALTTDDGTVEWQVDLELPTVSSPVVAGQRLYIGTTERSDRPEMEAEVLGIDTADGSIDWRWTAPGSVPTTASVGDGTLFISTDRTLHALA